MKKLVFLSVALMLVAPAWALEPDTTWTGAGDGWKYLDPLNWDNGLPVEAEAGFTTATTHSYIMNGDTVTIDSVGALAGRGRKKRLYVGYGAQGIYPAGHGHILLVPGGEITGVAKLGAGGKTGTVVQTGGNWLCTGPTATVYGDSRMTIGDSATGYGRYELIGGNLGGVPGSDMSMAGYGLGRFEIGQYGLGEFIQHPGTYVQCRGGYWVMLSGSGGGQGTYTMHGGTLRANSFYFSEYGTAISATWNITSTDVDIVLGASREPYGGRWTGMRLGYNTSPSAMRCYLSAPEGAPGETVQIEIVGGLFRTTMYGGAGRDADVAGLNNITVKFTKDPVDPAFPSSTMEAAGNDVGPTVAGLCNNFALEGLIVGGETGGADLVYLTLKDEYDNMGDGVGNEALYVENLTVNPGSWLILNKALYYYKADIDDMTKILISGGSLVQINPLGGDANMDVVVDDADLSILLSNFGQSGAWGTGDFNGDGSVDDADLSILLANFGKDACSMTTVPEPATLTLLGLGALALIRRRRNK